MSLILLIFLFTVVFSMISNTFVVSGLTELQTIEIKVQTNDTLWSIAKRHGSANQDIRETIYWIKQINEIDGAVIHPGQSLEVPQ